MLNHLTYRRGGTDRAGVETGDGILDAGELLGEHSVTVRQLLAGDRLGDLADAAEDGKASSLSGEVEPRPPALVTPDEAGEHDSISFQLELNGERMQDAVASDLIFSPPELLSRLSGWMTMEPGDIVSTGTPSGVGSVREPPVWLQPGDEVVISSPTLGRLRTRLTRAS